MIRAVHIDFRAQKLRADAIPAILRDLADLGYNAILAEYMDSFPYEGELAALRSPDAMTKEELAAILDEADRLGLEVIPLVQCFGHSYWVLRHPEFESLAEGFYEGMPEEEKHHPWGWMKLCTMCSQNPRVRDFWRETVRQIAAAHPRMRHFHIGGDEIKLPSCPKCLARVDEVGMATLLSDHYLASADVVASYGAEPMLWADIILAYPDTLPLLGNRVTVVDWDYRSNGKPSPNGRLWGGADPHKPDTWSDAQKKYIRPYFFHKEPELINPFPYVRVLKGMGCKTVLASAARCGGDSFCLPAVFHIPNTEEAVLTAEREGIDGFIITSWACRRDPWHLCTYPIFTAALRSRNPQITRDELNRAFAERYFGASEPALGALYEEVGIAIKNAVDASAIIASYNEFSDAKTGLFFGLPFDVQCCYRPRDLIIESQPDAIRLRYTELREALAKARSVLPLASPKTADQEYLLTLWHWAVDTLDFFCDAALFIVDGEKTKASLAPLLAKMEEMKALSRSVLSRAFTPGSVEGGLVTRFGHLTEYLERITE